MIWNTKRDIRTWLPTLQCHRGYWVDGIKQNTIESIKKAHALNYQMSEFDVRLTKDEVVVLFHDGMYDGKKIANYTYSELKQLQNVSTLDELLQWFKTTENYKLNIEIKNDGIFNYKIEKKISELVTRFQLEERVLISSFNPLSLTKIRFFNSKILRALLLTFEKEYGNNFVIKSRVLNFFAYPHMLNMRYQDFLVRKEKFGKINKKIPVVLWTVNNLEIWNRNRDLIHGIISDEITPDKIN